MARPSFPSGGAAVLLFDEDFDLAPPREEPEVILPVFTGAELLAAREAAAQEARDLAMMEAETSARAAIRRDLTAIAAQIDAAREEAAAIAEQSAEAIARLLLSCFATAFPALSARHGADEVAAVVREILPALRREPKIAIRINPALVSAMTEELAAFDADLAARARMIPAEGMGPGDAQITWDHGGATRDTASLWKQIENILAPAGLLNVRETVKEHALVE